MATGLLILAAGWAVLVIVAALARRACPQGAYTGDRLALGLVQLGAKIYARLVHRLRVVGADHAERAWALSQQTGRPVLLISNHKAGVDGLLISAAMPMFVRWMMAADMKVAALEPAYRFSELIFVCRETGAGGASRDMTGVREALRHLAAGGCVGIFPEGRLCRHEGQIYPFQAGAGLLVSRARPIVLPVNVRAASVQRTAYQSLYRPSRSVLEVMEAIDFGSRGGAVRPGSVVVELQALYESWVGPVNNEPPLPTGKE
jgi:1-acyl-sn-glycerol-3-phosphate acyltransferase